MTGRRVFNRTSPSSELMLINRTEVREVSLGAGAGCGLTVSLIDKDIKFDKIKKG
ncbi:hypothetical protein [Oceanobacillus chungangensis]|uniref:hypothetical protein n=1 Tax=Oceanobacillus chungangensis TaxID=1229152 RepID=UPI0014748DEE|nr:hypothetical protein [Oceanobacillus chungangensis]